MKKISFILLSLFLTCNLFAQFKNDIYLIDGKEIRTGFEDRKKRGYYTTMQINMFMGNKQFPERSIAYYPYWPSSSSYIAPVYNTPYRHTKLAFSPSVTITNGYMFNEHWAAGIGVGFEIMEHHLFPLFADIRYTLWDNKISPFFAIKAGYGFGNFRYQHFDDLYLDWSPYNVSDAELKHYGGLMLQPEIGVKIPLNVYSDLLITAAYRLQKTKSIVRKDYGGNVFDEWEHKEDVNKLSLGVAIMFR
jgi:hypothetical protein